MKRFLITLLIALAALPATAEARPVVLLLHPGGFLGGAARTMEVYDPMVEANGMRPMPVEYTLGDIPQAFRDVRNAAARYPHSRVYAYGESAGGTLAEWLAAKGYVDAAAANSPVTGLEAWMRRVGYYYAGFPHWTGGLDFIRGHDPTKIDVAARVTIYANCRDETVPCGPSRRYAGRWPQVRYVGIGNGHLQPSMQETIASLAIGSFRR